MFLDCTEADVDDAAQFDECGACLLALVDDLSDDEPLEIAEARGYRPAPSIH